MYGSLISVRNGRIFRGPMGLVSGALEVQVIQISGESHEES